MYNKLQVFRKRRRNQIMCSRKFLSRICLAVMSIGLSIQAEDLKAYSQRIYEEELRKIHFKQLFEKAPEPDPKAKPDIMQNLLFVNGDNGSGTAFKMQFGKLPVIVSNAHVFLGLQNPVIRDIQGRKYKILSVFGARERDLVIMTYRPKKNEGPRLRPVKDVSKVRVDSNVTAYGNSQGSQTHSVLPGKLLGLGYDRMEISCGIVGGNSGGPVMLGETGLVMGVSTYLTIRKVDPQSRGTRYGGKSMYSLYNVRRFATRIDNLTPNMLEALEPDALENERKYYAMSEKISDELIKSIRERNLTRTKTFLDSYSEDLVKIDEHRWTSSYLKREYLSNRRFLGNVFQILNEGDLILVSRLRKIWNTADITVKKQPRPAVRTAECARCSGTGRIYSGVSSSSTGRGGLTKIRHNKAFDSDQRSRTCPICSGSGRRKISNASTSSTSSNPVEYVLPESSVKAFRRCILKAEHPFNGFILGGTEKNERGRFSYYSSGKLISVQNRRLEHILTFRGNHRTPNAVETRLTFMFNRLVRVELRIPYSDQAAADYQAFLRKNFKDLGDVFQVRLSGNSHFLFLDCRHNAYMPLVELSQNPPTHSDNLF
ncbi:MAG: hypothetical protein E7055_15400 [Lentisphaerae bacterium]|nr:hypothetical protein [Lentisphaerota bacterium]